MDRLNDTLILAIIFLCTIGALVSIYLTWVELMTPAGTCPLSGFLSCSKALFGPYSDFFGIPMALYGLSWFLIDIALAISARTGGNWVLTAFAAWSGVGLIWILALVYVEVFLIGEICVYCTSAHIVALAAIGLAFVALVRGKSITPAT